MASTKAATSNSSNSCTEAVRCGLCFKDYTDPRHLNCMHSFCLGCLQQLMKKHGWKRSLLCPLCQKEMILPKSGVEGIPEDFYIKAKQSVSSLTLTSTCENCSNGTYARCRCLVCDVNLCSGCKSSHHGQLEANKEKVHHFLEFVDPMPEVKQNSTVPAKMAKTKCGVHHDEDVSIYCIKCKKSVCPKCKDEKHKAHTVQDTNDAAKVIRDHLSTFLASITEFLPEIGDFNLRVQTGSNELDKDLDNTIKDIQSRSKFLQREIEKIGKQLINEVKERHRMESEKLNDELKSVKKSYQSMADLASSAERMIKFGSDENIIDSSKRVLKRFLQVEDELPTLTRTKIDTVGFVPGGLKSENLQTMFGQCSKGEIALPTLPVPWGLKVARQFEMRSLASFKCKDTIETVHAIAPISDQEAWVCCGWGSTEVSLYHRDGIKRKTIDLKMQVDHMCITPSGELLVSSYEDKYIKKVDKKYNVCDFAIPHLFPGGMVMNKRKELFVCAVDSYTTRRQAHSQRVVLKMSEFGMNLDQFDEYGDQILFGAPYRVAEAPNRDLCVTDREEGKLRVTAIDNEGMPKNVYRGPPTSVKTKQPFNPLGLCCDRYGDTLISDWGNHCVHLLDKDFEFQGFMLSQKDGLFKPNAIAMDKDGNLWIGDGNATVRVFKYSKRSTD